jgi:hypothetical protein
VGSVGADGDAYGGASARMPLREVTAVLHQACRVLLKKNALLEARLEQFQMHQARAVDDTVELLRGGGGGRGGGHALAGGGYGGVSAVCGGWVGAANATLEVDSREGTPALYLLYWYKSICTCV